MVDKIGFLGLGIMGGAMAANLARAGQPVFAWNRSPGKPGMAAAADAGATLVDTAEAAVEQAQIVFLCLSEAKDVEEILLGENGVAARLRPASLVVDTGTTGPDCAQRMSRALKEMGVRFLDAPVSGGDVGARNGTLTFMVGGARADFDECMPFFQAMGKNIKYCGPAGSGQGVKLCNQVLCAVNLVAVCEALKLAQVMNIDPNLVVDVCSTGAAGSWALSNLGPKILAGDFEPAFMIKHMVKDLDLVADAVGNLQRELPGTQLARNQLEIAAEMAGTTGGDQGTQAMMRVYRPD